MVDPPALGEIPLLASKFACCCAGAGLATAGCSPPSVAGLAPSAACAGELTAQPRPLHAGEPVASVGYAGGWPNTGRGHGLDNQWICSKSPGPPLRPVIDTRHCGVFGCPSLGVSDCLNDDDFCSRLQPSSDPDACMSCRRVSAANEVIACVAGGTPRHTQCNDSRLFLCVSCFPRLLFQILLSSRRLPGTDVSYAFEQTCPS